MKTIVVSIGNSDNKLTQKEWAEFVNESDLWIRTHVKQVHFFGGASNWMPWQNVAWMVDCAEHEIEALKSGLIHIGRVYRQDSVAWLEGETQFL